MCPVVMIRPARFPTAKIYLSSDIKNRYVEVIPVLSGQGKECSITLLGRRRDDPTKLDKILSQPWQAGESVSIAWRDDPRSSALPKKAS